MEADNYATVWDALLKRYDNRRLLKKQLFRAIYDLPGIKKESAQELHELVDEFQRHVRALGKLDEPIEYWDTPLVNLLSYKLDSLTLRAWEEKVSHKEEVKYEELTEFLFQRVRILKSVASDVHQPQSTLSKVTSISSKKQFPLRLAVNAAVSESNSSKPSCYACSEKHFLFQCETFSNMPVNQRRELVSRKRLCWNCFRNGHNARRCNSKFSCRTCHSRHHTLLHDPSQSTPSSSTQAIASNFEEPPSRPPAVTTAVPHGPSTSSHRVSLSAQSQVSTVLLETVALNVVDDDGKVFQARALLDSGSMTNFMSTNFAKLLANPQAKVNVDVAGIGQSLKKLKRTVTATLRSRTQPYSTKLQFLVIDNPTADLPITKTSFAPSLLPDIPLADPQFLEPRKVDLVIGAEAYWEFHTGNKMSLGEELDPNLISTADDRLEASLQRFWEMETIPNEIVMPDTEKRCEEVYNTTTERNNTGRYVVRLPRTNDPDVVLGEPRSIAERRFFSLERRLERNPETKAAYHLQDDIRLLLK
ncbi:uncharacterized protein LOC134209857 [Armigeres subalbatus]|uniref:uncharacterized protein LOC134209857 n=1 Tax=Armigeres subalbatus TaxID=124917 RepID=UPI002ED6AF91